MEARRYLEAHYQLSKAGNDAAAMAWLQTHVPDLVIADLSDTPIAGYSLCHAIVHNRVLASVSILLICMPPIILKEY
jgi:PleD family two-component response regulator